MYGKHFQSMYTGSMVGSGAVAFAVWGYVIAHACDSHVELNPVLLATILGEPEASIQLAIDRMCAPDPASRNPDYEGRKLVKQDRSFLFYVPSWEYYHDLRKAEQRRNYLRIKQREHRAKKSGQQMSTKSTNTDADAATDPPIVPLGDPPKRSRKKPKLELPADWAPNEEHLALATARRIDCEAEAVRFRDWAVSKGERKADWNAAFRNWLRSDFQKRSAAKTVVDEEAQEASRF